VAGVRQGDRWNRVADKGDGGAQADRQRLALEKEPTIRAHLTDWANLVSVLGGLNS